MKVDPHFIRGTFQLRLTHRGRAEEAGMGSEERAKPELSLAATKQDNHLQQG